MKKLIALAIAATIASSGIASAQAVQPLNDNASTQTVPVPLLVALFGGAFVAAGIAGSDSDDDDAASASD